MIRVDVKGIPHFYFVEIRVGLGSTRNNLRSNYSNPGLGGLLSLLNFVGMGFWEI